MSEQHLLSRPTLVLNRSWQAICTTTVRHAIVLAYSGRAQIIATDSYERHDLESWSDLSRLKESDIIHGVTCQFMVPEVVILTRSNVFPQPRVVFSRRNIFKRDRFTCQYCGARPAVEDLTIDHVVPRSKGGRSTWDNCVVSCRDCNEHKGHKSVTDSGLTLRSTPKRPDWLPFVARSHGIPSSWEKFVGDLYWNIGLEQ